MMYIEASTGRVFKSHADIQQALKNVSLPEILADENLAELGFVAVAQQPLPDFDPMTHKPVSRVEKNGETWTQAWNLFELSEDEQQVAFARHVDKIKFDRAEQVASIVVTTKAGLVFDGDETSQTRMARAITAMEDADVIPWVLHDNSVAMLSKAELTEALRLSGAQMAAIWVAPYSPPETPT